MREKTTLELKEIIAAKDAKIKEQDAKIKEQAAEIKRLKDINALLRLRIYGSMSDKHVKPDPDDPVQLSLDFGEEQKEALTDRQAKARDAKKKVEDETKARRARAKKRSARPARRLYRDLEERYRTEYPEGIDLSEYDEVGRDIQRILHSIPPQLWVECIVRPLLRKKSDKNAPHPRFEQAPAPKHIIKGGHVAADFLTDLVINKFSHHLPEYRQVKMYSELGLKLSTSTVNRWMHEVARKLHPLYESQCEAVREQSDYLQVDEVPWRIADREDKTRHGYAWQFRDARANGVGLYFHYENGSRSAEIPRMQLKDFRGAIQTDGYGAYDQFEQSKSVTLLGCMAHARRYFINAQKSAPAQAAEAIKYFSLLYDIEANLRDRNATPEMVLRDRQELAVPILDEFEAWIKAVSGSFTPKDLMRKALDYTEKLLPRLRRYTLDGRYQIDNNSVERGQRPTVMGRKNYLFSKRDDGAVDNAVFYTLLGSCDVLGVNRRKWFMHVLTHIEDGAPEEDIVALLPCNFKEA